MGIPVNCLRKEDWVESDNQATQKKRKLNISSRQFLICDKISMCTKQVKYRGLEIVAWVRAREGVGNASECFGGMDVIDFGDLHQSATLAQLCIVKGQTRTTHMH